MQTSEYKQMNANKRMETSECNQGNSTKWVQTSDVTQVVPTKWMPQMNNFVWIYPSVCAPMCTNVCMYETMRLWVYV